MNAQSSGDTRASEGLTDVSTVKLAGKYMTFKLGEEVYGTGIQSVREIIRVLQITRVPRASAFIRGVINLRGKVIPVIDLRLKFGMTATEITEQTVVIVVQVSEGAHPLTMGVLVDQVLEVLSIDSDQIAPPPEIGAASLDADFILGIGKTAERVVFLLDIGRALSSAAARDVASAGIAA